MTKAFYFWSAISNGIEHFTLEGSIFEPDSKKQSTMNRLRVHYGLSSILYLNVFVQLLQSAESAGDSMGDHRQPNGDVMDGALKNIATPPDSRRCDKDTFDKLSAIPLGVAGEPRKSNLGVGEGAGDSRDKLSLDCRLVYLERFVERYEDAALNGFLVQRVEALTDDFIMRDFQASSQEVVQEQTLYDRVIRGSDGELKKVITPKTIRRALMHFARKDPVYRGHPLSNLPQLFIKYVIMPCDYYAQQFGPDLFDSASFVFESRHKMAQDEADFYFGWTRFRLCRYLSANGGSISRQVEHVNP